MTIDDEDMAELREAFKNGNVADWREEHEDEIDAMVEANPRLADLHDEVSQIMNSDDDGD